MPSPAPLVSIILRTDGRRPASLAQAIESARAQTYQNVELVIVEDGGLGATHAALGGAEPPPNARIVSIAKSGRSAAGNAGLEAAQGALINFLDDDDLLLPHHLDVLVNAHESEVCGAAYAWAWEAATFASADGHSVREKTRQLIKPGPITPATLLFRNRVPIQAVLFRRELFSTHGGFDRGLEYLEDWDLWLRYAAASRFVEVPEATSVYRVPAEKEELERRARMHAPMFDAVRRKILNRAEVNPHRPTDKQTPAVSVIIVNYNAGPHLIQCLTALPRQTIGNFEAFVIDNASTDGSFEEAIKVVRDERIRYFELPANTGFAMANNMGATLARAPWIATLNPDAFANADWLEQLLLATKRYPQVRMYGSTQLKDENPELLDGAGDCYLFCGVPWRGGYGKSVARLPPEGEVFSACAAAALYELATFRTLGGFDETFFCYLEDVDLSFRWRLRGGRTIQVTSAVVRHVGGASSKNSGIAFARYHGTRNLIWTFAKNMPGPLFWFLLPAHLAALFILLVRSIPRGTEKVTTAGIVAGMRKILLFRKTGKNARLYSRPGQISKALVWNMQSYFSREPVRISELAQSTMRPPA